MHWRRLHPHELDHETIWLLVTVGAAIVGLLWLQTGLPTPRCTWHDLTGLPCIGCGSTRSVRFILQGQWGAAFAMNPLVFLGFVAVFLFDLYAATVVFFRLPRLRFNRPWPDWLLWSVRITVVASLIANWAWLIVNRV